MAEVAYLPPTGPPPPKVPEGWKAVFHEQYHEWLDLDFFYFPFRIFILSFS
jgi:hypothetical protein